MEKRRDTVFDLRVSEMNKQLFFVLDFKVEGGFGERDLRFVFPDDKYFLILSQIEMLHWKVGTSQPAPVAKIRADLDHSRLTSVQSLF